MFAGFEFANPLWLWAVLVGPLLVLAARARERQGGAVVFPGAGRLRGVPAGWRARLRHLPITLAAIAVSLGAVALARPQKGSTRENVTTQGVDIVVALDISGSMEAEDFQPRNRLAVAKEVVSDFIKRRTSDRIGLVIFAAKSLTKAPPTTDTAVLLRQLDDVQLHVLPEGTAIGNGLATALTRLRSSKAKSRVVVLVTDGANNAGEIDPLTASDIAKAMEVRVYTVLVGLGGEVPIPVRAQDPFTGQIITQRTLMRFDVDPDLLKSISERTGGEFFRATDTATLRGIFDQIDKLEKTEIKQTSFKRYRELYPPVLLAAGLFLVLAGAAWLAGLRVLPA
jgi:Ca-activated chloride channel family protein